MNYLKYEEKIRQDSDEHQKKILKFYLPFFKNCKNVLDLACGKGNFLELLQGRGIGVDKDKFVYEYSKKKGLNVVNDDIINFLKKTKQKFDGVMASHIIEHFNIKEAKEIIKLIYEKLNDNGVLVIVTPNSESITAHLYFYKDPTHIRFYPHQLIRFFGEDVGFKFVENGSNPFSKAKIWDDTNLNELKNTNVDEISRIFLDKSFKDIDNLKKTINNLIKKINILENFILIPMDAYVVMRK